MNIPRPIFQKLEIVSDRLKKEIKLFKHRGGKYICPFCNYSSKDLFQIGFDFPVIIQKCITGAGKRNAGCYKCGSTDRERLIYVYLKEILKLFGNKNKKILHVAPEKNLTAKLTSFGFDEYVCGDKFTPGYSYPGHVKNIDILNLSFKDNYFDLIICNHVLEHIPNDIGAMKELCRILKPAGIALLQVPISKNSDITFEDFSITNLVERENLFGQSDHVRVYGQDYTDRLTASGFTVDRINISAKFLKFGLNKDEDIFVCKK